MFQRHLQSMIKPCLLILFFAVTLTLSISYLFPQEDKTSLQKQDASTVETKLFEQVNQEREKIKSPLLKLSVALSNLARKHSLDMAAQSRLSHLSSSGKSYQERLAEEKFYFADVGENIAFSDTFLAEYIHQGLMESPEHKKNILNPEFNQVGIGVVYKEDQGYYITQDFMKSLERKNDQAVKEIIQRKIDEARHHSSYPPLLYEDEASHFARIYAQRKAEENLSTPIPDIFGDTRLVSITTASIGNIESLFPEALDPIYERGGIGVWFARNSSYPGGAYFITLLLFPEIKYKNLENEELGQVVLLSINKMRQGIGIGELKLDNELSFTAKEIALRTRVENLSPFISRTRKKNISIITYMTKNLELLPNLIRKKLRNPIIKYVGIGAVFRKMPKFPNGAFWVTIAFKDVW